MQPQTLLKPAISTVYYLEKPPGEDAIGGITLLLEPSSDESVSWTCLDACLGASEYPLMDSIVEGIQTYCTQVMPQLWGVRILIWAWLDHSQHDCQRAFHQGAAYVVHKGIEVAGLQNWTPGTLRTGTEYHPNSNYLHQLHSGFKAAIVHSNRRLQGPFIEEENQALEGPILRRPIVSHVTMAQWLNLVVPEQSLGHFDVTMHDVSDFSLMFSGGHCQATILVKPIALVAKPCVVDKRAGYFPQDQVIFELLTDMLRSDLPDRKGIELWATQLENCCTVAHRRRPRQRQSRDRHPDKLCWVILKAAIQQALPVR